MAGIYVWLRADRSQEDSAGNALEVEQECVLAQRRLFKNLCAAAAERSFSTAGHKREHRLSQAAPQRITYQRRCVPSQCRRTNPTRSCTVNCLE
jgi:hypothetical protein